MEENTFKRLAALLQDDKIAQAGFEKILETSKDEGFVSGIGSGCMIYFKGLYHMKLAVIGKIFSCRQLFIIFV